MPHENMTTDTPNSSDDSFITEGFAPGFLRIRHRCKLIDLGEERGIPLYHVVEVPPVYNDVVLRYESIAQITRIVVVCGSYATCIKLLNDGPVLDTTAEHVASWTRITTLNHQTYFIADSVENVTAAIANITVQTRPMRPSFDLSVASGFLPMHRCNTMSNYQYTLLRVLPTALKLVQTNDGADVSTYRLFERAEELVYYVIAKSKAKLVAYASGEPEQAVAPYGVNVEDLAATLHVPDTMQHMRPTAEEILNVENPSYDDVQGMTL